jgi:hypothetical protein
MTAPTPVLIGQNSPGNAALQQVTTTAAAAQGSTVTVHIGQGSGSGETVSQVTDSAGNAYLEVAGNASPQPAWHYQCANVAAMPAGTVVSVQFSGASSPKIVAVVATASGATDQSAGAGGTGLSASASGGTMLAVPEVALATFCTANGGGAPSLPAGWTALASMHSGSQPYLTVAWQLTSGQGAETASLSIPVSANWGAALVTLIPAALPPPAIPVFSAGYGYLATGFDTLIQDTLGFGTTGILARLQQQAGGGQAIPSSTFTPLAYDTMIEDPYGGWSAAGTAGQPADSWLAPYSGQYVITMGYVIVSAAVILEAAISVSGLVYELAEVTCSSSSSIAGGAGASLGPVPMVGGQDWVQGVAWANAAVTTDTTSPGRYPWMEITCVSQ